MAPMAATTCSGVAVSPWPKLWVARVMSALGKGSWPRRSPGRSMPARSPKPKAASTSESPCLPSRAPMRAAPTLEEAASTLAGPAQPNDLWSWMTCPPTV